MKKQQQVHRADVTELQSEQEKLLQRDFETFCPFLVERDRGKGVGLIVNSHFFVVSPYTKMKKSVSSKSTFYLV